ncbi:hypothetical protein B5C34_08995 [Pacificimonas flava]|uniref:Alginate export domain-containing protein n=2 Tax=Pacificimonas TaxID=1960290 RepID=A0A219B612_9SPHN|nr:MULTISPECIES: alginate export family protein [Pacificimonas]MBZ6379194.1 alginate export family protein [Pacificimonas aurantium]OWV33583.1 hypothetical protein B5C34_08995 [Pacificimonas flava]
MNISPRRSSSLLAGFFCCTAGFSTPGLAGPLQDALGNPDGLTIGGSIRPRVEVIDGQFRPGKNDEDAFVSIRTIVAGEYDFGGFRLGGELRDARGYAYSDGASIGVSDVNALEPLQFYAAVDAEGVIADGDALSLIGGRTTLDIGSGRVIGEPGFANSVNSFTGGQLRWKSAAGDEFIGLFVMPSNRQPTDADSIEDNEVDWDVTNDDIQLYGAHFRKADLIPGLAGEIYAFGLSEDDSTGSNTRNRDFVTYGARLVGKPGGGAVDVDFELIRQTGDTRASAAPTDLTDVDVDAWFAHGEVGYAIASPGKPRLFVFADYGTGDDPATADQEGFDKLYGKRRGDFGPTGLYGLLSRENIASVGFGATAKPFDGFDAEATFRGAWLDEKTDSFAATKVRDASGNSGDFAGTQLALRTRYWLVPQRYRLEVGGVYFTKGEFLETAPNANRNGDTRYGYVALTASF